MNITLNSTYTLGLGTRICLGGEGLGLYGGKAITLPINSLFTTVSIIFNQEKSVRIFRDSLFKELSNDFSDEILSVLRVYNQHNLYPNNIDIAVESSVPIGYGLASSATFYACLTAALNNYFSFNLTVKELIQIAYTAEHIDQGVLVGLTDTYAVMYRKIILQDHSVTPSKLIDLGAFPSSTLLIIAGSSPSFYKHIGEELKNRIVGHEQGIMRYKDTVSKLVPLLARAFTNDDKASIENIISTLFQSICIDIGINNPDYTNMIAMAKSSGAYAAKNIGLRSHGGSVFALCDPKYVPQVIQVLTPLSTFIKVISPDHIK